MATRNSRILSIDVECVAINYTHNGRSPCSVAIVNDRCDIIYSSLIKPVEQVVSDLYLFTGLRIKDLEQAPSFDKVLEEVDRNKNFIENKRKISLFRFILYLIRQQLLLVKDHKVILNG